jgi:hypothetical protein
MTGVVVGAVVGAVAVAALAQNFAAITDICLWLLPDSSETAQKDESGFKDLFVNW